MNADLKDARILIVDDQPDNVEILEDLLNEQGYTDVKSTNDAREVAGLIDSFKPELLLLDLMMPHMNGFEVMDQIQGKLSPDEFMPILVLTADATTEAKQKALSGGANDFLTKPFDLIEVSLRIKNLLVSVYLMSQLKEHNQLLELKVRERTVDLQKINTELSVSKKKVEDMDKLKSFFLANISHEFRTPLVSILGYSEMLLFELNDPHQLQSVRNINSSAERLNKTLSDVIALVDIEKKKIEASLEKIDLPEFITKISRNYQRMSQSNGLSFDAKISANEVFLYTDPRLLRTIIDHVIDNAVKFTAHGGIALSVDQNVINGLPYAVIGVSDTGIGIPPEKVENIFTPFRQISEGLNRSYEGMGVGLSVAKQLVEILQGEISVISNVGIGTTVTIKLPVIQTENELLAKISKAKTMITTQGKSTSLGKPMILLVEDNEDSRTIFSSILNKDFTCDMASDGITAIAMAEVNTYDIILMDINLGLGIDGIETFNRIRQLPNFNNAPVIAITAFGVKEDRDTFLKLGFYDYIQKPVLRNDFVQTIKLHIGK